MNPDLIAALLAERFGPVAPRAEAHRQPTPHQPGHGDGGPDTDIATARRRRELCQALDDKPRKQAAA